MQGMQVLQEWEDESVRQRSVDQHCSTLTAVADGSQSTRHTRPRPYARQDESLFHQWAANSALCMRTIRRPSLANGLT